MNGIIIAKMRFDKNVLLFMILKKIPLVKKNTVFANRPKSIPFQAPKLSE